MERPGPLASALRADHELGGTIVDSTTITSNLTGSEMRQLLVLMGTITVISFVLVVTMITILSIFVWYARKYLSRAGCDCKTAREDVEKRGDAGFVSHSHEQQLGHRQGAGGHNPTSSILQGAGGHNPTSSSSILQGTASHNPSSLLLANAHPYLSMTGGRPLGNGRFTLVPAVPATSVGNAAAVGYTYPAAGGVIVNPLPPPSPCRPMPASSPRLQAAAGEVGVNDPEEPVYDEIKPRSCADAAAAVVVDGNGSDTEVKEKQLAEEKEVVKNRLAEVPATAAAVSGGRKKEIEYWQITAKEVVKFRPCTETFIQRS